MTQLETARLILRKWQQSDLQAVHAYASDLENVRYMQFGPNAIEETQSFLDRSIAKWDADPIADYVFAVTLKQSGAVIGGCEVCKSGNADEANIGYILHRDHWKQCYGSELARELVRFGFEDLHLHRIYAFCDSENIGSYSIMENCGMRREALHLHAYHNRGEWRDRLIYAILAEEWDIQKEIAHYNALPIVFDGFIDVPELFDGEVRLVCVDKKPAIPEKKYVPSYIFHICKGGEVVGDIGLRIGYTDGLYYGGQIGYNVREQYRGNGYAGKACALLAPIMRAHGMNVALITNNHTNAASRRVCEKLGARLIRKARLPEWHELYKEGQRYSNIFEMRVDNE